MAHSELNPLFGSLLGQACAAHWLGSAVQENSSLPPSEPTDAE
jgi:hypothetical protein